MPSTWMARLTRMYEINGTGRGNTRIYREDDVMNLWTGMRNATKRPCQTSAPHRPMQSTSSGKHLPSEADCTSDVHDGQDKGGRSRVGRGK